VAPLCRLGAFCRPALSDRPKRQRKHRWARAGCAIWRSGRWHLQDGRVRRQRELRREHCVGLHPVERRRTGGTGRAASLTIVHWACSASANAPLECGSCAGGSASLAFRTAFRRCLGTFRQHADRQQRACRRSEPGIALLHASCVRAAWLRVSHCRGAEASEQRAVCLCVLERLARYWPSAALVRVRGQGRQQRLRLCFCALQGQGDQPVGRRGVLRGPQGDADHRRCLRRQHCQRALASATCTWQR
jgi:hypothetical protein